MQTNKKLFISLAIISILLINIIAISALSAPEAWQEWLNAKVASKQAQEEHRNAKIEFAADKSDENKQKVIDTGKASLHAALNEAEAWLIWKDLQTDANSEIPDDLRETIKNDIEANKEKINSLRTEVDNIKTNLELGIVFLKMIGKYTELLTDVARDSGKIWVFLANERANKLSEFEQKLRDVAENTQNKDEVIEKTDTAASSIDEARLNIDNAEMHYDLVTIGNQPLNHFAQGNNYLRTARANLLSVHQNLNQALGMLIKG